MKEIFKVLAKFGLWARVLILVLAVFHCMDRILIFLQLPNTIASARTHMHIWMLASAPSAALAFTILHSSCVWRSVNAFHSYQRNCNDSWVQLRHCAPWLFPAKLFGKKLQARVKPRAIYKRTAVLHR